MLLERERSRSWERDEVLCKDQHGMGWAVDASQAKHLFKGCTISQCLRTGTYFWSLTAEKGGQTPHHTRGGLTPSGQKLHVNSSHASQSLALVTDCQGGLQSSCSYARSAREGILVSDAFHIG